MPEPIAAFQRKAIAGAVAIFLAASAPASFCAAAEFRTGGYSFSDELGGFRLLSATGRGTTEDPVILVEELYAVAPATIVIRNHDLVSGRPLQAQLTLIKRVRNRSNRVWAGFEMELQELHGKPSVYTDGLSFKQFAAAGSDVSSDSFAQNERDFEPYDRIEFLKGHVDPGATAEFKVAITDPTPTSVFYLLQDPKLLAAGLPLRGPSFAALR
jgi:hypothetical protein